MDENKLRNNIILITYFVILVFFFIYIKYIYKAFLLLTSFLTPIFIGIFLAFLLNTPVKFFYSKVLKFINNKKLRKALSIFSVYIILIFSIILFLYIVVPQIVTSILSLNKNISLYTKMLFDFSSSVTKQIGIKDPSYSKNFISLMFEKSSNIIYKKIPKTDIIIKTITQNTLSISLGFVFSIYMLFEKKTIIKQMKNILIAFLPKKVNWNLFVIAYIANVTFYNFIIGQIIDCAIILILCFIGMSVLKIKYALLSSVIIAVTNLIPIAGPWIGGILSIIMILMFQPEKAVCFAIFIIILQQTESNFIYPKIVSEKTGISGLWALFSIFIGGKLLGIPGMLIGVPFFAIIQTLLKEKLDEKKANR